MARSLTPDRRSRLLGAAAVVVVVALGGALLSAVTRESGGVPDPDPMDVCAAVMLETAGFKINCAVATGARLGAGAAAGAGAGVLPVPVGLRTGGTSGCVAGPRRPVLDTAMPTMTAAFAAVPSLQPVEVVFEHQRLDGTDGAAMFGATADYGGSAALDFPAGALRPGESYRWRVRGAFGDPSPQSGDSELGWSAWCEFSVGADVYDLGSLDGAEIGALSDLGLRPERRYPVTLTVRQWRAVLDHVDKWLTAGEAIVIGDVVHSQDGRDIELDGSGTRDRRLRQIAAAVRRQVDGAGMRSRPGHRVAVTLGGDRWASLAVRLDRAEEGDVPDGPAYWMALHLMSQQLAGSGGRTP